MDQERIGIFIQEQRKAHGLTQQELADRVGVTNKAVSKWEKGRSMPDVSLFEPICEVLEISVSELLAGKKIEAADQQQAAEELLKEEISKGKLIGLEVFLMFNTLVGLLLATSPLVIRNLEKPFSWLLCALGIMECVLVLFFDFTLPGKDLRTDSFLPRVVYAILLFTTLAIIGYPKAIKEGIQPLQMVLSYAAPCAAVLIGSYLGLRTRKKHRQE